MRMSFIWAILLSMSFSSNLVSAKDKKMKAVVYTINSQTSAVHWTGTKIVGSHNGDVAFKSGELRFNGDKLIGGEFTVDMSSISNKDLTGEMKDKLLGHLKSPDFFDVAKYPTATFKIVSVSSGKAPNTYAIKGDLTIKGKSSASSFVATIEKNQKTLKAHSDLSFDRTVYGIRYGSGKFFENLGDKAIGDEVKLAIDLNAGL